MSAQLIWLPIQGVKLTRDPNGRMVVSLEINGEWVAVITDYSSLASHIVEPNGIREVLGAKRILAFMGIEE